MRPRKVETRKEIIKATEAFKSVRGFKSDYQDEPHDGHLKLTNDMWVPFDMGLRSFAIGMPRTSNPYRGEKWRGMAFDWYNGWDEGLKKNRLKFRIEEPSKQSEDKIVVSSHQ